MKIQMWQSHGQPETMQKKVYGPKLRLSCDNCSKSKVRCDHERPSCQRCFHAGNPCVYSLSRRTGKPSSKSTTNIDAETLKNNARMKSTSVAVQTESSPPPTSNSTSADTTPSSTATTVCNDSGDGTLDGLLRFDMSGIEPLSSHVLSDHNFTTPSNIALDESINISNISEYDEILNESIQTYGINKDILSSLGGGLDLWNLDPTLCPDMGGNTSANRMGRASSCPSLPSSPLDIAGIGSGQNHGNSTCGQLISSTLYNLSLPSTLCTTSPGLAQHSTIDRILSTSRQAMTASYTLLQCSCAKNPSSALSIVLIIFKILDSYGTIARSSASTTSHISSRDAGANRNSKDGNHGSVSGCEPGPPTSSPLLSFPQMEQSLVLGASITIGMYEICAEDKRRIILNLLVSELRRVELLAEEFGRQFEGEAVHREDNIYGTLRQFILSRVYAIHAELNAALQWA